ncbi:unnamed protein product [Bursaphelenchus xylophilus]|uniref:(pine wood nematode) hypothetical protein n=1 Tax=Bursaphelenchus xylophilus TaxID=6326 RepID=A0A1I7SA77_BURXY|nr:unnamed protein product [Bursaphelenchus xylophilus]CAG9084206.1 unnamed protein product [Bursaphelenchus xylophilus]
MELDMIANLITKDFNRIGKKEFPEDEGSSHHMLEISHQNTMASTFGNGADDGSRINASAATSGSANGHHFLITTSASQPKIHAAYLQPLISQPTDHHINNNLLHGVDLAFSNIHEQLDVSNILNMSHINGHLQNVSLSNTAHLGTNGGNLSALPFNGHHVVAAVASSSATNNGGTLLSHMQNNVNGLSSHVQPQTDGSNSNPSAQSNGGSSSSSARTRHRSSANDSMFKCNFCPKKFTEQNALRMHMEECRLVRSHECPQCGKRFKARGGLQQHNRIHLQERPYHCHYCPKRFNQKSHLDQHERIHTGQKPFACQFCGRAFRQRSQQMGHEATHTNAGNVLGASGLSIHHQQTSQIPPATMVQQTSLADSAGLLQHSSERSSLSSDQSNEP